MDAHLDRTLIALSKSNFATIRDRVHRQGLAFFSGFVDTAQLLDLGRYLGEIYKHRDSDEMGITYVKNVSSPQSSGFQGFTSKGTAAAHRPQHRFTKEDDGSYTLRYRRDDFAFFSSTVIKELGRFDDLAARCSFSIKLSAGEGYVINNRRWLHGREAFSGEREFLRLLVSDRSAGHKGIPLGDEPGPADHADAPRRV
jgi:alpha-ketoglutarate-dependent taurine dioxygenase